MANWEQYRCNACGRTFRSKSSSKTHRCGGCKSYDTAKVGGTSPPSGVSIKPSIVDGGSLTSPARGSFSQVMKDLVLDVSEKQSRRSELIYRLGSLEFGTDEYRETMDELEKVSEAHDIARLKLDAYDKTIERYSRDIKTERMLASMSERLARAGV